MHLPGSGKPVSFVLLVKASGVCRRRREAWWPKSKLEDVDLKCAVFLLVNKEDKIKGGYQAKD